MARLRGRVCHSRRAQDRKDRRGREKECRRRDETDGGTAKYQATGAASESDVAAGLGSSETRVTLRTRKVISPDGVAHLNLSPFLNPSMPAPTGTSR